MKITQAQLHKIIVEEYIKEENLLEADQEEIEKLLQQIQGDKYRSPEARDPKRFKTNDGNTAAMERPFAPDETMADPVTGSDEEVVMSDNIKDAILKIVQGSSPAEVAEIFNDVFGEIRPEEEEAAPETLYTPGAEGRPTAGFKLQELKEMIRKAISESV